MPNWDHSLCLTGEARDCPACFEDADVTPPHYDKLASNPRHTSTTDDWRTPKYVVDPARTWLGGTIDLDPASSAGANETVGATFYFGADLNGFVRAWDEFGVVNALGSGPFGDTPATTVFLNPPGGVCDANGRRWVRGKKGQPGCEVTGACGLPPGHVHEGKAQSAAKAWWYKLAREWAEGRVRSAVFLGFSVEILQTCQVNSPDGLPQPLDCLLCFPKTRVSFVDPTGKPVKGNTHSSVLVGLHDRTEDPVRAMERWRECFSAVGRCR